MKAFLPYIRPFKKPILYAMLFMLVDVFCEVMQPRLMSHIVGRGIESGDVRYILMTGALMVAVAILAIVGGFGNARCSAQAGVGFSALLRQGLFEKVQNFSFRNIDDFSTASLSTRLTNDITQIQNAGIMCMRLMVRAPLMLVFALTMAIQLNGELALILAVTIPLLLISMAVIIFTAMPRFNQMQIRVDRMIGSVQEALTNVRVVKSFVRQNHEKKKFKQANDSLTQASLSAMMVVVFTMPVMMLLMNLSTVAVVWFGGNQVIADRLQVAQMSAFINYIMQILMSLMMLSMMFVMFSRASASFKRVLEVLRTDSDLTDRAGARPHAIRGEVTFEQVDFKYNPNQKEDVLSGIDFTARPGQVIAIIGGTGAGKSSLVSLIPRLYDVSGGRVLIDGVDVRDYTLDSLRGQIGVVLQKNTLFSGTIRENLRWGDPDASDEQIEQAARAAQAHDFILTLKDGYDAWVEQGGVNLSGGQRQRLCIARAMLKKPPILILDDSTSAVDTATESKIRQAFYSMLKDSTVFLIAQRISSVQDADQIVILNDGKIAAVGDHKTLLATSEEYQEIYASQMEKEASA